MAGISFIALKNLIHYIDPQGLILDTESIKAFLFMVNNVELERNS